MTEKRGYEVSAGAWPEFDEWVATQPDYVQNLSMLDQLILYRDDSRPIGAQIDPLWFAIGLAWLTGLGVLVLWALRT